MGSDPELTDGSRFRVLKVRSSELEVNLEAAGDPGVKGQARVDRAGEVSVRPLED